MMFPLKSNLANPKYLIKKTIEQMLLLNQLFNLAKTG